MSPCRYRLLSLICSGVIIWCFTVHDAGAARATRIYEQVAPSIVRIEDDDRMGSGIVLDSGGTILTNFSSVNSPLPNRIIAYVERDERLAIETFDTVKVISVHPRYDAAIVKVETNGARFVASPIRSRKEANRVAVGGQCYTIGCVGAQMGTVNVAIAAGIVSANNRVIDDDVYYQTDAAMAEAMYGGALCLDTGEVVGLLAHSVIDTDGIGFVIPVAHLNARDMVPFTNRVGDPDAFQEYASRAHAYSTDSRRDPLRRNRLLELSSFYFRRALPHAPDMRTALFNVALSNHERQRYQTARAYLDVLSADDYSYREWHLRGETSRLMGDFSHALACFEKATRLSTDNGVLATSLFGMAMVYEQQGDMNSAMYYLKWSLSVKPNRRHFDRFRVMSKQLRRAQFVHLKRNRDIDFSNDDRATFLRLGIDDTGVDLLSDRYDLYRSDAFLERLNAGGSASPVMTIVLPAPADEIQPALGGVYMIAYFQKLSRLTVYSIVTGQSVIDIPVPNTPVHVTAAGPYLFICDPIDSTLSRWNLISRRHENIQSILVDGQIAGFAMGLDNHREGLMLVRVDGQLSATLISVVDAAFTELFDAEQRPANIVEVTSLNVDSHLRRCLINEMMLGRIDRRRRLCMVPAVEPSAHRMGDLSPSPSWATFYTTQGYRIGSDRRVRSTPCMGNSAYAFVDSDDFFLEVDGQDPLLRVRAAAGDIVVHSIELPDTPARLNRLRSPVLGIRRANRVAVLSRSRDRFHVFRVSDREFEGALDGDAIPRPGVTWAVDLATKPGDIVVVEDGPEGVSYDEELRHLFWDIPVRHAIRENPFLVSITPKNGDEYYKEFSIIVAIP